MNKMKEKILKESFGYKGLHMEEDYVLTNLVKGFVEDYKEFGNNTANLYKTLFMLEDDTRLDLLQNNIEYITEMVNNLEGPFLFEDILNNTLNYTLNEDEAADRKFIKDAVLKGFSEQQAQDLLSKKGNTFKIDPAIAAGGDKQDRRDAYVDSQKPKPVSGTGLYKSQGSTVPEVGTKAGPANPNWKPAKESETDLTAPVGTKAGPANPNWKPAKEPEEANAAMKDKVDAIIAAPNADAAMQIAASADKTLPSASDLARGAGTKAINKGGIFGMISRAFGKVKNFFTGGIASIGSTIKEGKWGDLLKIPLVKGALITGGAVAAFALIKKLFGNKVKKDQVASLQAQLAAAQGKR